MQGIKFEKNSEIEDQTSRKRQRRILGKKKKIHEAVGDGRDLDSDPRKRNFFFEL